MPTEYLSLLNLPVQLMSRQKSNGRQLMLLTPAVPNCLMPKTEQRAQLDYRVPTGEHPILYQKLIFLISQAFL